MRILVFAVCFAWVEMVDIGVQQSFSPFSGMRDVIMRSTLDKA